MKFDSRSKVESDIERIKSQFFANDLSIPFGEPVVTHGHPLQSGSIVIL